MRVTGIIFTPEGSDKSVRFLGIDGKLHNIASVSDKQVTFHVPVNIDAKTMLAALKDVDGDGSGLDADLLDGKHADAFALSGHAHSYAGSATAGGATNSAVKLATARSIQTNLGSTAAVNFDGSGNITPGVTGTLPIGNGGLGNTTGSAQYLVSHSIAANTNLNSITTPGFYACNTNATAQTLSNCPTKQAFTLIVTAHAGTSQILIEYPTGAHIMYQRNYYNGTWGGWRQIYTTINAPTSVSGNAGTATKLATARTIALSTGVTGTATSFNGSANIMIPVTAVNPAYLSAAVAVAKGGTGGTTVAAAQKNLGIVYGAVDITPTANTPTKKAVSFGITFTAIPAVFVTANSAATGMTTLAETTAADVISI